MKKFLSVLLFALLFFSTPLYAQTSVSVLMDGNELSFDTPPAIVNGFTMIPFRAVGEAMGAEVQWSPSNQVATFDFDDRSLSLIVGNSVMECTYRPTGQTAQYKLDVPAQIMNGRTLVPLRAISEALDCDVDWNGATKTVSITTTPPTTTLQPVSNILDSSAPTYKPKTYISNRTELLTAIGYAISHLEKEVTIKFALPYTASEYEINLFDFFYEISAYSTSTSTVTSSVSSQNSVTTTYSFDYKLSFVISQSFETGDISNLSASEQAVYNAAKLIIDQHIKPGMSDYDKEKAIHDYLVLNTKYDEINFKAGTLPSEAYSPYGILINKTGVCDGYSHTFKMFMDILGIECDIISGQAQGSGSHSWNRVKLDDEYYLVDVTWDDPVPDRPDRIKYDYFNVTDSIMAVTHSPSVVSNKVSKATKYNYYYYNNLVVSSQSEFDTLLKQAIKNKQSTISLRSSATNIKTLLNNSKALTTSCSYSINDATNSITIDF